MRLAVTPADFDAHLRSLRRAGFTSVGLDELDAPGDGRRVALTFDDGFLDTYSEAFPALLRHGFTATVFVVTGRVGTCCSWGGGEMRQPLMSWSHVREMAAHGIDFQSHSRTHLAMPSCDDARLVEELAGSRAELEERLGRAVRHVAYPYGSFDGRVLRLAHAAGYRAGWAAGMSTAGGMARERLQIAARDGIAALRLKASGWASWLRRARHGFIAVEETCCGDGA